MARSPVSLSAMYDAFGMPEEHSWNMGMAVANNDIDPNKALEQWLTARFRPQELALKNKELNNQRYLGELGLAGKQFTSQADYAGKQGFSDAYTRAAELNQQAELDKERIRQGVQRIANEGTLGAADLQAKATMGAANLRGQSAIQAAQLAAGPKTTLLSAYKNSMNPGDAVKALLKSVGITDPFQQMMLMSSPEDQLRDMLLKMRQSGQLGQQPQQQPVSGGIWGWLKGLGGQ